MYRQMNQMEEKPRTCVAYCTVCHSYIFMASKEELVRIAAARHVEETHHTVIVGYEIYDKKP